ncbi:cytochrome P450 [Mycobacterium sp. CPCC 205372]|uniref:Cytochrome P450 n=1 Tax=Mycobacterium hippophais TaxID=3016340 RepID=A0ABT4PXC0_9MYCO|nr:cytochrome P450 [Mycobacterium hippophais]MCZ8381218.1 cytochrome P450 [Mycobacterium hippophais]
MAQPDVIFDPFSAEYFADPHTVYRRLRDEAPVYYNAEHDFYALTRHSDVAAAYRDFRTFSSTGGIDLAMVKSGEPPPSSILFMDPPEHRRMRGLLAKAFTPNAVRHQRSTVTDLVRKHLGAADPRRFDVVQDFAALFPVEVITRITGVPEQFSQQVRHWIDEALHHDPGQLERTETSMAGFVNVAMFYFNLVQQRRAEPHRDDMIGTLIAAEVERDNGELSSLDDLEIAGFATLLGGAGAETVTKLVGNAVAVFADHPDQWRMLVEDRSMIGSAVEEVLRYEGPVQHNIRRTLRDTTLHGVTIPAGKPVLLCGASANRDPRAFTDPDTFDIDRDHSEAQQLGLGFGVHICLGAALARMETAIALDHLLDFMPRYDVLWDEARRISSPNMSGWSHLPVAVHR